MHIINIIQERFVKYLNILIASMMIINVSFAGPDDPKGARPKTGGQLKRRDSEGFDVKKCEFHPEALKITTIEGNQKICVGKSKCDKGSATLSCPIDNKDSSCEMAKKCVVFPEGVVDVESNLGKISTYRNNIPFNFDDGEFFLVDKTTVLDEYAYFEKIWPQRGKGAHHKRVDDLEYLILAEDNTIHKIKTTYDFRYHYVHNETNKRPGLFRSRVYSCHMKGMGWRERFLQERSNKYKSLEADWYLQVMPLKTKLFGGEIKQLVQRFLNLLYGLPIFGSLLKGDEKESSCGEVLAGLTKKMTNDLKKSLSLDKHFAYLDYAILSFSLTKDWYYVNKNGTKVKASFVFPVTILNKMKDASSDFPEIKSEERGYLNGFRAKYLAELLLYQYETKYGEFDEKKGKFKKSSEFPNLTEIINNKKFKIVRDDLRNVFAMVLGLYPSTESGFTSMIKLEGVLENGLNRFLDILALGYEEIDYVELHKFLKGDLSYSDERIHDDVKYEESAFWSKVVWGYLMTKTIGETHGKTAYTPNQRQMVVRLLEQDCKINPRTKTGWTCKNELIALLKHEREAIKRGTVSNDSYAKKYEELLYKYQKWDGKLEY